MSSSLPLLKPTETIKELHHEVKEELDRCKAAKEALDRRRSRRNAVVRKMATLQNFCDKMSKLLESFPDVHDAAKAANQQIGGGLVACLSLLFQIGRNKNGREEAITDAIDRLTLGLEQMKRLADALDHPRVEAVVQKVYKKVENFCKKSIEYYKMAPWGRLWEAIANPYKLGITIEIDGIKDAIMVALQMGFVMHISAEKGKDEQSYKDRSEQLADRLLANNHQISRNVSKMKAECERLHKGAFSAHPGGYSNIQLQEINIKLLERQGQLQSWLTSEKPSILLLLGANMDENDDNRGLLWLSPAALQILQTFNPPTITCFYSPSPQQPGGYRTLKVPFDHLLSSVINQLLNSSRMFFDKHYGYVSHRLEREKIESRVLLAILLRLLRSFQKDETVVMVLDRLDLIEQDDYEPWDVIDKLVEVVCDSEIECTAKLAIVGLQDDLREIRHIDKVTRKRNWAQIKGREVLVHGRLDWRQEALDDN